MEPVLSEIVLFAGNFAPQSYMLCKGQLLPISQYNALYALIGTIYGGDGIQTFALPNFQGRCATGTGQGPGLSNYDLGQIAGSETVTLTISQMPAHNHSVIANYTPRCEAGTAATSNDPTSSYPATTIAGDEMYTTTNNALMGPSPASVTIGPSGGSIPFEIMQPYLGLNFIIAVEGIFPSRN